MILSQRYLLTNQSKLFKTLTYLGMSFVNSLPWLVIETAKSKIFRILGFHKTPNTFFSVFCIFRIASKSNIQNFTKLMKLTKQRDWGPKMSIFSSKTGVSKYSINTEYSEYILFLIYGIYCFKIEFIFLQKTCSNSNLIKNLITITERMALIETHGSKLSSSFYIFIAIVCAKFATLYSPLQS